MFIKELNSNEFQNFALSHPLNSFCQSHNYALVMGETGYDYEFIGLTDGEDIFGAALILYKNINGVNYGYSPKGFLIDYLDKNLLNIFTELIIEYYYQKNFAFIKINPNIQVGEVNKDFDIIKNNFTIVKDNLIELGYKKLKDNLYFESMLPRFNPIINLNSYKTTDLTKNTRNKIKKGIRKGLTFEKVDINYINFLDIFLNSKDFFYNDMLNIFSKNSEANLFIVSIDKAKYIENSQNFYLNETNNNQLLNDIMIKKSTSQNINKKMNSDISLLAYKKDVMDASKLNEKNDKIIIAAALILNYNKNAEIIASGYDNNYRRFAPNYFLHYSIIKHYKKISNTLNINGISGDFSLNSPYEGLNRFKLGFSPNIYENIGEFDLIVNEKAYKYLLKNGILQKEFQKK